MRQAAAPRNQLVEPTTGSAPEDKLPTDLESRFFVGNWYNTNLLLLGENTRTPPDFRRKNDYEFSMGTALKLWWAPTEGTSDPPKYYFVLGGWTTHRYHPTVSQFDVNDYGGQALIDWHVAQDIYLAIGYEYEHTHLGHDPFISSHRVSPVFSLVLDRHNRLEGQRIADEKQRLDIYYRYNVRNYLEHLSDPALDRDGNYHTVGSRWIYFGTVDDETLVKYEYLDAVYNTVPTARRNGYLGYEYRSDSTDGDEFDRYANVALAGLHIPLSHDPKLALDFNGEWGWSNYTRTSLFDERGRERFDFEQHYRMSLTWIVCDNPCLQFNVITGVEWNFVDSNISHAAEGDIYDYDRFLAGILFEIRFRSYDRKFEPPDYDYAPSFGTTPGPSAPAPAPRVSGTLPMPMQEMSMPLMGPGDNGNGGMMSERRR